MYPSLLDQFTSPKKIPVNSGTNGNTVSTDTVSVSRWLLHNLPFTEVVIVDGLRLEAKINQSFTKVKLLKIKGEKI